MCVCGGGGGWGGGGGAQGSCSLENLPRDFFSPEGQGCTRKVSLVLFSKAGATQWEGLGCVLVGVA